MRWRSSLESRGQVLSKDIGKTAIQTLEVDEDRQYKSDEVVIVD